MKNDFCCELENYRKSVVKEGESMKDSQYALQKLRELWEHLDGSERIIADQLLNEWILSEDEGKRFDAQHIVRIFKLKNSVPALQNLATRLLSSETPGAPYELEKVNHIISEMLGTIK
jgi:hypothetical protein